MNVVFIIVLIFVQSVLCNEFYSCVESCADILDGYDDGSDQKTEITLTMKNFCKFKSYLQKFNEYSTVVCDNDSVIGKYVEYYNLGNKKLGVICEQEYIIRTPDESKKSNEKKELCLYGDELVCGKNIFS
jgi:hypothetical protein